MTTPSSRETAEKSEGVRERDGRMPTHVMGVPIASGESPVPVPPVPPKRRAPLTKLQRLVLTHLTKHGPCALSYGTRSAVVSLTGNLISMKSDGYHAIITSGMVAAAKGNYPASYMKITPYGAKCLERGYRDNMFARPYLEVMAHWHAYRDGKTGGAE